MKEILTQSIRVFREMGYHGASMRAIGDAAGMNKGNIYYYFENKDDLLFRVLDSCIRELVEGLQEIAAQPVSAREKLRLAIEHLVGFSAHRQDVLAILVQESRFLSEENRRQVEEIKHEFKALLEAIIRQGVESGEFRALDPNLATLAIIGMCNWMYAWYSPTGRRSPAEISGEFARLLLDPIDGSGPDGKAPSHL